MTSEKGCRKDKNQNIQVFVRLRPLNQRERDIRSLGVIEVLHDREVVVRQPQTTHTRKFTFDRAFGPNAKQVEVYQEVVSPLIEEVLAGYNCTVFAYGQTGTGKTHTMVGENTTEDANWQNDPLAGIIPRSLSQLFDELRISNTEHTVRVSYLELYNEELFDLLSTSEDNSKLRIYEDVTRKGSNLVNGLEEITVYNKNEVYKIMAQGQERKRVASTLMNAQSSRSHTVFSIVVHMKENSPDGEELVKIGKLNLVDLAGSENISKAGSDNPAKKERARECVNINQSLLTLGRVITALVEKHPHVPYRESKLTRILQESLGGRTKTSIIATVSPGHKDLEETMSTLEYANRAKNIQNKPEINQKKTKKAMLKQFVDEIDRLKKDLHAAREKNGVYLTNETYTELTLKQEEQRKEIQELLLQLRAVEEKRDKMESIFTDMNKTLEMRELELHATKNKLSDVETRLANTHNVLRTARQAAEERAQLVAAHRATESALGRQARDLLAVADQATAHLATLHDTVDRRRHVEASNLQATRSFSAHSSELRARMFAGARDFTQALTASFDEWHRTLETFISTCTGTLESNNAALKELLLNVRQMMSEVTAVANESQEWLVSASESRGAALKQREEQRAASLQAALAALLQRVAGCVHAVRTARLPDVIAGVLEQRHEIVRHSIESLNKTYSDFQSNMLESEASRAETARTHRAECRAHIDKRVAMINEHLDKLEKERTIYQVFFEQQEANMVTEQREADAHWNQWAERERRLFEERIEEQLQYMREDKTHSLAKQAQLIEMTRTKLDEMHASQVQSYRDQLEECARRQREEERGGAQQDDRTTQIQLLLSGYSDQLNNGTAAISSGIEAWSRSVEQAAQNAHNQLMGTLQLNSEQAQSESAAAAAMEEAARAQFAAELDAVRADLVRGVRGSVDAWRARVEAYNASTISTVGGVSAATEGLAASARHHADAHSAAARGLLSLAASFEDQLQDAVHQHAHLEGRYLNDEYQLYTPTGATPQRTEYRYPRALAATSPHPRILARMRAARHPDNTQVCTIDVDSDPESQATSDGDSSLSEESAVFAAPSPPGPAPRGGHPAAPITKCTSESDIYNIRRKQEHQGKENTDRSLSNGGCKESRLRAPSSHKKPLLDRNGHN